ncbi:MAG: helix-turn-helix transcriptional regulator [Bdellovibrionales bacterium]|nr:helix-turn-helix transcriptional regulator [Bdellovibrionales bacterium]
MMDLQRWKTQFKKGYLELCILSLVEQKTKVYGFEMIEALGKLELRVKEGTLYPLLHRLREDGLLEAKWETESSTHPRKFYFITGKGKKALSMMEQEFEDMRNKLSLIKQGRE